MEELSELCRSGRDVRLGDDAAAEELAAATTILQEHGYVQDPHDPLLFVLNRRPDPMASPPSVKFPDAAPQIEYTPPSGSIVDRVCSPAASQRSCPQTPREKAIARHEIPVRAFDLEDYLYSLRGDIRKSCEEFGYHYADEFTLLSGGDISSSFEESGYHYADEFTLLSELRWGGDIPSSFEELGHHYADESQGIVSEYSRTGSQQTIDPDSWLPCTCIQLATRRLPENLQVRIPVTIPHLELRDQRVGIELVIEPRIRMGRANVDVELRTRILFVGVHSQDAFKDAATLGYYPFRMRFSLEPQLEDLATVAIPLYTERASGNSWSGTRTRSTCTKIGAQIGFGPVSISGERSWGMQMEESRELEMVSAGDEEGSGNTAVFEWKLLRWSHSGVKYNSQRPHSGLSWTKSLKAPFPGENIGAKVNDFPDVLWHLPPTPNFPIKFNFQLDVEMHLVWFAGKNKLFRAADWTALGFQFCHQFQVSPGR